MIWRSILNIIAALLRNAFQCGHQCILLEQTVGCDDWTWKCSCGWWRTFNTSELDAIKTFGEHVKDQKVKV